MRQNLGGVAYNVTRALHLLNNKSIRLLTVAGKLNSLAQNDSTPVHIHEFENESTASYISLLDSKTSELISGFGDMGIYERQLTPKFLDQNRSILIETQWIMFDANLSSNTIEHLVHIGKINQKKLVFISAGGPTKAQKIRNHLSGVHVIFCNRLEFQMITNSSSSIEQNLKDLLIKYPNLKLICITLGSQGVLVGHQGQLKHYQALKLNEDIRNVTGAGDSFAAGVMSQLLKSNFDMIDRAIACGLLAARLTLASANTISEKLQTIDEKQLDRICSNELQFKQIII